MRIGLQTWGTDGDFMPFLALAIGLKDSGHEVTLAYTSVDGKDYSDRQDVAGIKLIRANGNVAMQSDFNPYAIDARPGSFKEYSTLLKHYFEPFTEAMYDASEQLCTENELVIGHAACHTLLTASQKHGVKWISLVLVPLMVESKHVSPLGNNLGTFINSMMWRIGDKVSTKLWFKQGQAIRKREGLPPIKSLQKELFTSDVLTLVAASETIAPRQPDWNEKIQVTGFLDLPMAQSTWEMPEDLKAFLAAGEPPVFMTFGSCTQFDIDGATELMMKAAKISGKRTIVQSDWSRVPQPTDPNVFCIGRVPHAEVFPYCSLIVHHGGAGTTQAALLAGKPSVVVAHGFDQPYWAQQLAKLGVGGRPLNRSSVTPQQLSAEIRSVAAKPEMVFNAQNLGMVMNAENGVRRAISLLG